MSEEQRMPKTADSPLNKELTDAFILDLSALLKEDGSPRSLYQLRMLLSKYTELDENSALDRRARAIEKWLRVEDQNAITNDRLRRIASYDVLPGVSAMRFTSKAREIVNSILPFEPSLAYSHGSFSGGASTSKRRRDGHPAIKFRDKADATARCLDLHLSLTRETTIWTTHMRTPGLEPRRVRGNVLFTVPKSSDIDRCAAKEPDLNVFWQKSFGYQIRTLLKRKGVDLNDQSINAELAREGSITGALATVDLSSASDSVSTELVRLLLPESWFYYLDLVRSPFTDIDGNWHENEMFSSMGNGFTFELESLLFYSLARTTAYFAGVKGRISVYGDDIIIPSVLYDDLSSVLAFYGFTVNESKSHFESTFRESCGAHWDQGHDWKPFYLRKPFQRVSDLILTLNQLTQWASRTLDVVDPRYENLHIKYRAYVPENLWGGSDLTSRTSLVTGHSPRGELVYATNIGKHSHIGGLILWLFTTLNREREGCLSVVSTSPTAFARVRRRKERLHSDSGHDIPLFLSVYSG